HDLNALRFARLPAEQTPKQVEPSQAASCRDSFRVTGGLGHFRRRPSDSHANRRSDSSEESRRKTTWIDLFVAFKDSPDFAQAPEEPDDFAALVPWPMNIRGCGLTPSPRNAFNCCSPQCIRMLPYT